MVTVFRGIKLLKNCHSDKRYLSIMLQQQEMCLANRVFVYIDGNG